MEDNFIENSKLLEYFIPAVCICGRKSDIPKKYPIDTNYAEKISGIKIKKEHIGITVCKYCGHEYINPMPKRRYLDAFYSRYMLNASKDYYSDRLKQHIPNEFRCRYKVWLDKLVDLSSHNSALLDIGSGAGMFLRYAREYGFAVEGVEPNDEMAKICVERYNIPIINTAFEEMECQRKYDIITMWDILEHLPDPESTLRKASLLLQSSGIIVVEIPARDSFLHIAAKVLFTVSRGIIERPLYLICGIHHLHYFSKNEIRDLLVRCNYQVLSIDRRETELERLYRTSGTSWGKLVNYIYNCSLCMTFLVARLIGKQNKMVIIARTIKDI